MSKVKPRHKAVVHVVGRTHLTGKKTVLKPLEIVHANFPEDKYGLMLDHVLIATCEYAKRLADWAFEHGSNEVAQPYDLKLSDWEP